MKMMTTDIFIKIDKVLDSCQTTEQLESAKKYIELSMKNYQFGSLSIDDVNDNYCRLIETKNKSIK